MEVDRYKFSTKKVGKFETVRFNKPPVAPDDQYIITREGDRFDLLSHQFYGDVSLWWFIALANDIRPASMIVPEGIQLRIPTNLDEVGRQLESAELDK
jgi:nucleoid-associated protein YgaU